MTHPQTFLTSTDCVAFITNSNFVFCEAETKHVYTIQINVSLQKVKAPKDTDKENWSLPYTKLINHNPCAADFFNTKKMSGYFVVT